jgi:predicted permease
MKPSSHQPIELGLRLYRALAEAFPQEFKNAYGEELLYVTEESIADIWQRNGLSGLFSLLLDVVARVLIEHLAELKHDIRYGVRMLLGAPGFTVTALVSLSVGICIAASAYSELHSLVLRDTPAVQDPDRLVTTLMPISYPRFERFQSQTNLFSSSLAYLAPVPFAVSTNGHTERFWGHLVTPTYFSTLGVRPMLGRFFDQTESRPGQSPAVVLSYRFWNNHLGQDPLVVGKTLRINGHPSIVLGVGPEGFVGASSMTYPADLWLTITVNPAIAPELDNNALERRDLVMFQMIARLKPGVTIGQAEAALDAASHQMDRDYGDNPDARKDRTVRLVAGGKVLPVRKQDLPIYTEFFFVLGGMVLSIACANVANMLLARAADRRKEIAVRLSLGASRWRLIRQLLTESLLLSLGGGVLGFCLAWWVTNMASQVRYPYPMPIMFDMRADYRALLFTVGLSLVTGIIFGLVPAWQATGADITPALKEGGAVRLRRFRKLTLRNILVLCQVAGSLALLLMTGYLALGCQTNLGLEAGFDPRNLYMISVDPVRDGYSPAQATEYFKRLMRRIQSVPGFESACLTDSVPGAINGRGWVHFSMLHPGAESGRTVASAMQSEVGSGFFQTTGIPILAGRDFDSRDESPDAMGVIVSEALARRYPQTEDLVGRRIEIGNDDASGNVGLVPTTFDYRLGATAGRKVFQVIGVVHDVVQNYGIQKPRPAIYFPLKAAGYAQPSLQGITLIARASAGFDAIRAMEREVAAIDSTVTPFEPRTMAAQIGQVLFMVRVAAWTYGFIGISGLLLAAVGLAGVTSYSVMRRAREIGIRMALGARKFHVLALVLKETTALVATGTLIGLLFAWAGTRALGSIFSTVAQSTAVTKYSSLLLFGAPVLLAALALSASYIPARKSTRIDPVSALRQE